MIKWNMRERNQDALFNVGKDTNFPRTVQEWMGMGGVWEGNGIN